ncbi:MAG: hypothetical protein KGD72_04885 [Candidatus Lokiarchaeota archaeon]|nr:hypothetical protein [Candidatus Lokiarchaeota archaeon]
MVLFATPWEFSFYFGSGNAAKIVLWLSAIIGIIFALFLLASYLNTRKREHLYWGISFALLWINTHIAIAGGTYAYFLQEVPATFSALMVGLFAVGLFINVKPEKEKLGNYLLIYVIAMSLAIGFFKQATVNIVLGTEPILVSILVMALHIPSAILIIWLPLQTREENGKSALMMTIAGALMSLVGLLLALATLEVFTGYTLVGYLFIVFSLFPFVYLAAIIAFAWGIFVPKRWSFDIAGIELED